MTNLNPEQTTTVDDILTLAVVELLVHPDFVGNWLREVAEDLGVELTELQGKYLDEGIYRTLDQLAIPFVESLPAQLAEPYRKLLSIRDRAIHPLPEEQSAL